MWFINIFLVEWERPRTYINRAAMKRVERFVIRQDVFRLDRLHRCNLSHLLDALGHWHVGARKADVVRWLSMHSRVRRWRQIPVGNVQVSVRSFYRAVALLVQIVRLALVNTRRNNRRHMQSLLIVVVVVCRVILLYFVWAVGWGCAHVTEMTGNALRTPNQILKNVCGSVIADQALENTVLGLVMHRVNVVHVFVVIVRLFLMRCRLRAVRVLATQRQVLQHRVNVLIHVRSGLVGDTNYCSLSSLRLVTHKVFSFICCPFSSSFFLSFLMLFLRRGEKVCKN